MDSASVAYSDIPDGFAVEAGAPAYADIPEGFTVESGGETVRAKTPAIRPPMYKNDGLTQMTAGEIGDQFNRQPASQVTGLSDAFNIANDPSKALGFVTEKFAGALGSDPAWAARLGRDARDLLPSLGPLGTEFPAMAVPSAEPKAIAQSKAMPSASVRTEAELLKTGGARMKEAKLSEETVPADALRGPVDNLKAKLQDNAIELDPELHPIASRVMSRLESVYKTKPSDPMAPITGTKPSNPPPLSLTELHNLKKKADLVIEKGKQPNGQLNQEGLVGQWMKGAVDEMIAMHPEGSKFAQGSSEYARAKKSQIITEAMEKARNSVLWDRGKESAALRHQIKSLLDNKKYKNMWSAEERSALKSAKARTLMEVFGGFGSKNVSGAAFGRLLEMGLGLPPGTLWVPGYFARQSANTASMQKLEAVGARVRAGGDVQEGRVDRLKDLLSEKVLTHVLGQAEGAKRVGAWISTPSAQTARALGAYVAQKLNVPATAERIMAELQGTEQTQADEQQ